MMELLVLFEEDYVLQDDIIIYVILGVWTVCLFQFTICFTATRSNDDDFNGSTCSCCTTEVLIILSSVCLQDAPFLAVRLYIIIKNQTLSYTILFFTLKNALVLTLQAYRFIVLCCGGSGSQPSHRLSVPDYTHIGTYTPKIAEENPAATMLQKVKPPKIKKKSKAKGKRSSAPAQMPYSVPDQTPFGLPGFPSQATTMNTGHNVNPAISGYQQYSYN